MQRRRGFLWELATVVFADEILLIPPQAIFILSAGQCSLPHSKVHHSVCSFAGKQHNRSKKVKMSQLQPEVECLFFVFLFFSICALLFKIISVLLFVRLHLSGSAWTFTAV